MITRIALTILLWCPFPVHSQDYTRFTAAVSALINGTPAQKDSIWNYLVESRQIPLVAEDSVAFLYRGTGTNIEWLGDFNNWGYEKSFSGKGTRIDSSDIWYLKTRFPLDARLDYKISIGGGNWILDPNNPHQQWSGLGGGSPNSELRMPRWKRDPVTLYNPDVPHGRLERDLLFTSRTLGYQITFSVYLPPGGGSDLPVVYVTDGYEYMHEQMGNMPVILDNLAAEKKLQPLAVVFIDQREPANRSNNRKMQELTMNPKYLTFIKDEFLPYIESRYPVSRDPKKRAILGNGMGGLSAVYFSFAAYGVFGMAGIQSPSFWFKPEIYAYCDNPENPPLKIFMTSGLFSDYADGTRKMKDILEKNTCNYWYMEVNQGHSWGNWRDTIDDILIFFFPPS